jgi:hypothetical protein
MLSNLSNLHGFQYVLLVVVIIFIIDIFINIGSKDK